LFFTLPAVTFINYFCLNWGRPQTEKYVTRGDPNFLMLKTYYKLPWIPEPLTVNNTLKRREGSGSTGRFFVQTAPITKQN
jgi:hypothetical protein